jgi:hypothetical protein
VHARASSASDIPKRARLVSVLEDASSSSSSSSASGSKHKTTPEFRELPVGAAPLN